MITYHVGEEPEQRKPEQLALFSYGEQYGCKEVWKSADEVLGVSGYAVSSEGRVRGRRGWILSCTGDTGYPSFKVHGEGVRKTVRIHRVVAALFCLKPEGSEVVNHKDGNKKNSAADNLEWTTHSGNVQHYHDNK